MHLLMVEPYTDFYYRELNELHSSIESGSYFHPADYRAEPFGQSLSGRVHWIYSLFKYPK